MTPTIETIREGVQFTPEAADAFRRADAQVLREIGRHIDVNSTYRSRELQLSMWQAWEDWINGRGPRPNHSKALHPDDPLAFHVTGTALDSDDWVIPRINEILAENGFIRNRLYVAGELHHYEYVRSADKNYRGIPTNVRPNKEDEVFIANVKHGNRQGVFLVVPNGAGLSKAVALTPGSNPQGFPSVTIDNFSESFWKTVELV